MTVITRFAPSPTGMLHIGNARTALINWLYARKHGGKFILRIDDTDKQRSKEKYIHALKQDLSWLGLDWDDSFNQSDKLDKYKIIQDQLVQQGRLYPCYETQEELELKRTLLLKSGKPPIYDRSALKLTDAQKQQYEQEGRTPHYRFLINHEDIQWGDLVKGQVHYHGSNLSDPIIVREDGTMTYMLCSTVDDIDANITHVIRGEDHVSNTAIQKQLFEALGKQAPCTGHLSLVKAKDNKISKRLGGFEIASLRDEVGLEPMSINSFFALIGTSHHIEAVNKIQKLIEQFDISLFSKSPTTYMPEELERLNHKLIIHLSFEEVNEHLKQIGLTQLNEAFWLSVRPNLQTVNDIKSWWDICHNFIVKPNKENAEFLKSAAELLPSGVLSEASWKEWTSSISNKTGKKGKELFMPLRLALTGVTQGPELSVLLPLIGYDEIIRRLTA